MPRVSEASPARYGYGTELVRPRDGITLVLGDQGTGKSYLFKKLVKDNLLPAELLRAGWHLPIVLWDPRGRFLPRPGLVVDRSQDPEGWAKNCFRLAPCAAMSDEADEAFPSEEGGPRKGSALNELMRYARNAKWYPPHYRPGPVPLVVVGRRPLDFHTRLRSSANVLIMGRISLEGDRKTLERDIGVPKDIVELLASLPDRKFLRWDKGE